MNGVAVTLPMEEWNKVLAVLSQAPWSIANPLIMAMGEQLRAAKPPAGSPDAWEGAESRARPNGVDRDPPS